MKALRKKWPDCRWVINYGSLQCNGHSSLDEIILQASLSSAQEAFDSHSQHSEKVQSELRVALASKEEEVCAFKGRLARAPHVVSSSSSMADLSSASQDGGLVSVIRAVRAAADVASLCPHCSTSPISAKLSEAAAQLQTLSVAICQGSAKVADLLSRCESEENMIEADPKPTMTLFNNGKNFMPSSTQAARRPYEKR